MTGIYKIVNNKNGKTYFGQAVDYEKRKSQHIRNLNGGYHRNRYLQSSWDKYGAESFDFVFVEECSAERLNALEIDYIREHNTLVPNGYNLTSGGDGVRGMKWSEESRKRFSDVRTGMSLPSRKGKMTEETLEKQRRATRALWADDEFRKKVTESHIGRVASEETRKKMSESHKGIVQKNARKVLCVETSIVFPSVNKIDIGRPVDRTTIYRSSRTGIKAYGYHWKLL